MCGNATITSLINFVNVYVPVKDNVELLVLLVPSFAWHEYLPLSATPKLSTMSDEEAENFISLMELRMRMWGGSLTRITPSFIQTTFGAETFEDVLQYSWTTDPATTLWTPPLVWTRMFGRSVTVNWAELKEKWIFNKCGAP